MVAVVKGNKKDLVFKNIGGRAVGDLAQIGFISKRDYKVLLDCKCLVKYKNRWFIVLRGDVINKKVVKETILKYIN